MALRGIACFQCLQNPCRSGLTPDEIARNAQVAIEVRSSSQCFIILSKGFPRMKTIENLAFVIILQSWGWDENWPVTDPYGHHMSIYEHHVTGFRSFIIGDSTSFATSHQSDAKRSGHNCWKPLWEPCFTFRWPACPEKNWEKKGELFQQGKDKPNKKPKWKSKNRVASFTKVYFSGQLWPGWKKQLKYSSFMFIQLYTPWVPRSGSLLHRGHNASTCCGTISDSHLLLHRYL